jgi:hypothetical protein
VIAYLDQFCWVHLLAAREQHPRGNAYQDALLVLETAVAQGKLVLPLSEIHYIETANRQPYAKRRSLAALMINLSRGNTVAPFTTLVRAELRRAIADWFPSRVSPDRPEAFGRGGDHAFGQAAIGDAVQSLVDRHGPAARAAQPVLEWGALARHPDHDAPQEDDPRMRLHDLALKEAERLEKLRALRVAGGWTRGERSRRVWSAQAYVETVDEFNAAFEEAGVPAGHLMAQGADTMTAFLADVPTLHAHYELARLREQADSRPWRASDLRDIDALSVAVVYADAVVTEKTWCDFASRSGLAETHGTVLLRDIREIVDLVIR